jgi:TonB-linked SusC/RagA family outer membrane protein
MRSRIVLFVALLTGLGATSLAAQARVVTGRVTDAVTGEPVVGAEVSVPNTDIRTFVADDGTFSLGIPTGATQILIRRIGYKRYLITVPAGQNAVDAQLERDVLQLEEVVVTGVATGVSRQNLANAVASVQGEDVQQVSSQSIEHALQGKVVGADIQTNSGAPGGGAQVRMRGVTSINATASPLWVIDGVIASDVAIPSNQNMVTLASTGNNPSLTQDAQVNRIADLNPEDIETIEVLKGASASAIYGSKASNGVIIVTTKRGRVGAPRFNVRQKFGTFDLSNKLGFNSIDTEAKLLAHPLTSTVVDPDEDGVINQDVLTELGITPGVTYDLEEQTAGRHALSSETAFDVSGATEDTRYFLSGLWKNDEGIMENTGFEKQSLRVNVDQNFGDRVRGSLSTNFIHTLAQRGLSNNDNAGVSPYMVYAFTAAVVDLSQRPDGTFADNPFERSNPVATLANMKNDEDVWRLIASGRVDWDLVRSANQSLQIIGLAGVDFFRQENDLFFPPELQFEDDDGFSGTSLLSNTNNTNITLNGSAVYTYLPSPGTSLTTSAGVQYATTDLGTSRIESRGLTAGQENVSAGENVNVRENRQRTEDFGFFLQEEVLTLDDRLLLTAGFRADQSSANADDTKLYFFPKFAGSLRFPGSGAVTDFKVRVAYGESGNQPLFGDKFSPLDATNVVGGVPGIVVAGSDLQANVGADDLRPERQREIEGGFDATLFDGRATLEVTAYQKNISDLILRRRLAPSSGFGQEIFNGGKLRTRGLEVGLGLAPVQSADFNWLFRTNFFMSRSKVTELQVPSFLPANGGFRVSLGANRIQEGSSATLFVGNVGVDANGSAIEGEVGDINPDFKVSFTNDLTWKYLGLYFHFDWQQGGDIVNLTRLLYDLGSNTEGFDEPDHTGLTGDERNAEGPFGPGQQTGIYVEEGTFLKLREITLSYRLPDRVASSVWSALRDVRLTFSGRNLVTLTGYSGMDPEVSNFGNQPSGRNIDVAPFPRNRSFWFGIDLGF